MALVIQDRYHLIDLLGSGGMGVVHLGWDAVLERYVAVKRVRGPGGGVVDGDETWRAFREEAQLVAGFRHPGIVGVYDFGIDEDGVFIITELVEGFDLERLVSARGPCNELAAALICYEVSGALHAAHAARIIHRDVKPSNVMVDSSGRVLLMDFGIALRGDAGTADVRGTPLYMAPEQFSGAPAGPRTDLWGLGCALAWLLTGKPPVAAKTLAELGSRLRSGDWEPELTGMLERGGAMSRVLGACLERNPEKRYQDARVLQGDLGQVIQASLVPDPREELSRAAREWFEELGEAVFRIPAEPPDRDLALGETLDAPGLATPVAATPHPAPTGLTRVRTETFPGAGAPGSSPRRSGGPLVPVLWGLFVLLAIGGAVAMAAWLTGFGVAVRGGADVRSVEDTGPSSIPAEDRTAVAIWIHGENCPPGRAESLAGAAQALVDRWPDFEVIGPAMVQGLAGGEGPLSEAEVLALGRAHGWRALVTGRCGTGDGADGAGATIYDLRWDPPLKTGSDIQVRDPDGDETRILDRWSRRLATRIWSLLPMGCGGPAVALPSREAARLLSQARALIPRYTREDLDEALRLVERARELAPGAPEVRLVRARLLVLLVDRFAADRGLLDDALADAAAVAAACPQHRRLPGLRAIIHATRGESHVAIRLLQEALERFPTDPVSWNLLAVELGIVGRAQDKVDALRRVLGRDPRDWNARINLGYTLRQLGQLDAATAEYRQVVDSGASLDEKLWAWDGLLWTALSRGDLAAAGAARDALLTERAEHWTLESVAALAWFEGRCEDVVGLGQRARRKSPGAWVGGLWAVAATLGDLRCGGPGAAVGIAKDLLRDADGWPPVARMFLGLRLDALEPRGQAAVLLKGLGAHSRPLAAESAAVQACREGNAAAALAQLDRALGEEAADAATRLRQRAWKVRILGSLGRYDEAVLLAEECRSLVAAPDWWMFHGQAPRPEAWAAVLALKTPDRARRLADHATRLEPMDPEAWLALGLAARGQADAAAEAEARRRFRLLNPAPEWMEQACGATAFEAMRRLAVEWSGDQGTGG
jgi:tetratricopeptide (TPR) repeat protein